MAPRLQMVGVTFDIQSRKSNFSLARYISTDFDLYLLIYFHDALFKAKLCYFELRSYIMAQWPAFLLLYVASHDDKILHIGLNFSWIITQYLKAEVET